MANNSYKRRLDDMNTQSSLHSSSKRKRGNELSSPSTSSNVQTLRKKFFETYDSRYKDLALGRSRSGTPFAEARNFSASRPYVGEGATGFSIGSSSPLTPLRQRHYSPRRPWSNEPVVEVFPRPLRGTYNTPRDMKSATVAGFSKHLARDGFAYGPMRNRLFLEWSSELFGRSRQSRPRPSADVLETLMSSSTANGRLVVGKSYEHSSAFSTLRDETRALERTYLAEKRESEALRRLNLEETEDSERAGEMELGAKKDLQERIASLQGDDTQVSNITRAGSNLQQPRFMAPDSALENGDISSNAPGEAATETSGLRVPFGGDNNLASTSERRDDAQENKPDDWRALYEQAKSRDHRLDTLKLEQEYAERQFAALSLNRPTFSKAGKKDADLKDAADAFTPLSEDAEEDVDAALEGPERNRILTSHDKSNIEVTRAVMQCLLPGAWLNDEVINLYMELLKEREVQEPKKFLKCHFFNTFFYNKLYKDKRSYDYKAVRRWTTQKKLGYSLSDCDKILVPIHQDIHWCLAVINIRDKKLEYLDSLKGGDNAVLKVLGRYIADEAKDKDGKVLDTSTWEQDFPQDIPQQMNGCDCGMFMLKYADFHSRGAPLSFKQAHMQYFRRRMVWELLRLKAT